MMKQEKATQAPILLTEAEMDHVSGGNPTKGNGLHLGELAKEQNTHPWALGAFKGVGPDKP